MASSLKPQDCCSRTLEISLLNTYFIDMWECIFFTPLHHHIGLIFFCRVRKLFLSSLMFSDKVLEWYTCTKFTHYKAPTFLSSWKKVEKYSGIQIIRNLYTLAKIIFWHLKASVLVTACNLLELCLKLHPVLSHSPLEYVLLGIDSKIVGCDISFYGDIDVVLVLILGFK